MPSANPINWVDAELSENPFSTEPVYAGSTGKLVWAGLPKLKHQFESVLHTAAHSSEKQVVLNFGPYGGGKTHASQYFSQPANLPPVDRKHTVQAIVPIVVKQPKEPEKGERTLYLSIIEKLGFQTIVEVVKAASAQFGGASRLQDHVAEVIGSQDLAKALTLLAHDDDENNVFMLRSYFLQNKNPRSELRKLGIARNIDSIEDRFGVLAAILQLLIGVDRGTDISDHRRVLLWLDEMEDLVLYPVKYHRPFTQGLRDLLGKLPSYFTLMMNFTLASPEALEDIEVVLGSALLSRVTSRISFGPLSREDAYNYVLDLMRQFRPKPLPDSQKVLPFTPDSLSLALETIPEINLTPREINKRCHDLVVSAITSRLLSKKKPIDVEFIRKYDEEQAGLEV